MRVITKIIRSGHFILFIKINREWDFWWKMRKIEIVENKGNVGSIFIKIN